MGDTSDSNRDSSPFKHRSVKVKDSDSPRQSAEQLWEVPGCRAALGGPGVCLAILTPRKIPDQ